MTVQSVSALLTAAIIAMLAAVFLRVWRHAHEPEAYAAVQGRAYRIRARGFWLLLVGLPISVWLFRENPYTAEAAAPQVINAVGYQWYWELDRDEVTAGKPVEFRFTSADVNHGFGIYDAAGTLVAQTQAMPGYVNRLIHVFEAPGTYQVLCLEYCGLAHHAMTAEIQVTAGGLQ
jgi:cytochrome c oxidase subunit 2